MSDDKEAPKRVYRQMVGGLRPGQPIEVADPAEVPDTRELSPLCAAIAETFRAYYRAGRDLLEGQYASVREHAPPQLRIPCHIYVVCCPDGALVRYDAAGDKEEPKVRFADRDEGLEVVAPAFSEQVIHIPSDRATYAPELTGPSFQWVVRNEHGQIVNNDHSEVVEHPRFYPLVYASKALPADFKLPVPPARPPCLASLNRELQIQIHGVLSPADTPAGAISTGSDHFIAHGLMSLPVGWQAIEIYPVLGKEYWRPEYAAGWAQLDLLSAVAQYNIELAPESWTGS
jgi:hypothetical protein